jgi:hypothetical protein
MSPRHFFALALAGLFLNLGTGSMSAQIGENSKADKRIERLLNQSDIRHTIDEDGDFRIVYAFDDDRSQLAFINSNTERYGHMEIREIWSVGLGADQVSRPEIMRKLLKKNDEMKLGSWKIMTLGGQEHAVFYTQIAADADAETLQRALHLVSQTADEMEKEILGTDDF